MAACSGISPTPENFVKSVAVLKESNFKFVYPTDAHERKYGLRARCTSTSFPLSNVTDVLEQIMAGTSKISAKYNTIAKKQIRTILKLTDLAS